jgi:hypothetical protein
VSGTVIGSITGRTLGSHVADDKMKMHSGGMIGPEQPVDQQVGATLIHRASIVGAQVMGGRSECLLDLTRSYRRQYGPELTHAVIARSDLDPTVGLSPVSTQFRYLGCHIDHPSS